MQADSFRRRQVPSQSSWRRGWSYGCSLVVLALVIPSLGGAGVLTTATHEPEVASPAVIALEGGRLEVFVRGKNSELVQRSFDGSRWSGWKNLGGDLTAAPTVTSSGPGRLDVFVRGASGDLVHRFFEGGRWSGWDNLGGDLSSAPAAVSPAPGRIDVFVRGGRGELVQRTYRSGRWGGWNNLGGSLSSAPTAVAFPPDRLEVFVRRPDLTLVQRSYDGSRWGGWRLFGGDLTAAPAVAGTSLNDMHVFVRGLSGELVQRSWDGRSWSGWKNLGGTLSAGPAATAVGDGRLEVFVRGTGDDLVQRSYDGRRWNGWQNLGGDLRGKLRARLRILTHNVYGLGEAWCTFRAREFGWRVAEAQPAYDIVALQEYYNTPDLDFSTCDAGPLRNAIWSTGRYRNSNNYYRHYPEVSRKPDGGISIFTLHPIRKFNDWRWKNDRQGGLKAAEGFIFARIEIPFTGVTLDTYIVHLNSGPDCAGTRRPDGTCLPPWGDNGERRRGQLRQLREQIVKHSRTSRNPVLILGDFNIGGPPSGRGNPGYEDIVAILKKPDDLWMSARPRENGYTFDCLANNTASDCDYQNRIDYIFVATDRTLTNSPYLVRVAKKFDIGVVRWRVTPSRLSRAERQVVERFGGFRNGPPNVADHFGLEAVIEIRDR